MFHACFTEGYWGLGRERNRLAQGDIVPVQANANRFDFLGSGRRQGNLKEGVAPRRKILNDGKLFCFS